MEWHFVKYRPNETTRDPIVGEFFSTETIENPAQALVREGIQTQVMSRIKGKGNKDTEEIRSY
jgi:hypothetical protein